MALRFEDGYAVRRFGVCRTREDHGRRSSPWYSRLVFLFLLHAGLLIALLPVFQYRSLHERRSRPNHGDL